MHRVGLIAGAAAALGAAAAWAGPTPPPPLATASHAPAHASPRAAAAATAATPGGAATPAALRTPRPDGAPGATGALRSGDTRPLRLLAAEASVIVVAQVASSEAHDRDRLRVHELDVTRTLHGTVPAMVSVVEIAGAAARPPILRAGERVAVLLAPAPSYSYLAEALPAGPRFVVVAGRDGVIPIANAAEEEAVREALTRGRALGPRAEAATAAERRALATHELASGNPRLTADALTELRHVGTLAPLGTAERTALAAALANTRIAAPVRAGLIELLAERGVTDALPAIGAASLEHPAVLAAQLVARTRLGAPPSMGELTRRLAASEPDLRAAAVQSLAWRPGAEALATLERHATSDDLVVRLAAVEAIGASRRRDAMPLLRRTFEAEERTLAQASARAILAIGGAAADDALLALALEGGRPDSRRYAAMLFLTNRPRDHPGVARLQAPDAPPEVREAVEEGLQIRGRHVH